MKGSGPVVRLVSLAAAAAMVLTMGGCATPSAEKSSTEGRAAATATAGAGETERKTAWRWLSKYIRPGKEPMRPGDLPPGKPGLFSGKDGEFVLYRKGEGASSDPTKPSKVRR